MPVTLPRLTATLTTERITIAIRDLPLSLHGTTLVQLSDLHWDGHSLTPELLTAAIARCNAIQPDLVVLTGDFITGRSHHIRPLAAYLQCLQSRLGTYAILGNHDSSYLSRRRTITRALASVNIRVLWNEIAYPLGQQLPLVGLADLFSRQCYPAMLLQLPDEHPRIVLAHNPDTMDSLQPFRADLVLSGHTHGGQIELPGLGPAPQYLNMLGAYVPTSLRRYVPFLKEKCDHVFKHWDWASGWHQIDDKQLYVNRGLGSYWPGRWGCDPELTVITLVTP
jgi:predicted MPP superfamily phosphohydrolase